MMMQGGGAGEGVTHDDAKRRELGREGSDGAWMHNDAKGRE
jgi:hypothetical protein